MTFTAPLNYFRDSDGFTPPTMGGAVAVKYNTLAYTDTTAKTLFTLPAGAVIVDVLVSIGTVFNAGDANVIDVGLGSTANAIANDLAAGSLAQLRTGYTAAALFATPLTVPTAVTATFVPTGTPATTGAATIAVFYVVR